MKITEKELLKSALQSLNLSFQETKGDCIDVFMDTENEERKAIQFIPNEGVYTASYDEWEINNFGVGDFWKNFSGQTLTKINKEYSKMLVLREAEKLTPEYGQYVLTEEEDQFKLSFPQMQSVGV